MIVNKKSWHFKLYSWFNGGKLPDIIDLCSYCRTVMFWAPLKFIFLPALWLHEKSVPLFYLILISLVGAIGVLLFIVFGDGLIPYFFTLVVVYLFLFCRGLHEIASSDWEKAEGTKIVQYTAKMGKVIGIGLKYSVGLLLETVFWTIWVKMYNWHKTLFWSILSLIVAASLYGLYLIDWKVLIVIAIVVVITLSPRLLISFLVRKDITLKDGLVWQFLVAQKRKICPFIEPKD